MRKELHTLNPKPYLHRSEREPTQPFPPPTAAPKQTTTGNHCFRKPIWLNQLLKNKQPHRTILPLSQLSVVLIVFLHPAKGTACPKRRAEPRTLDWQILWMGGLNRPDTPERLARNVTNNSSKKFSCSSWRSYLAKMIFPPLDFSVSLTESAAWTSMNISAIPPCRSQPRWVCTNMQGLDYCNWVTGKPMPPPTFSMTALTRSYTATATPTSWSPTSYQQYNLGLTYPSPVRSLKAPTTASSLLPALCVQCYLIIFSHTTFSKIKTSSICMIHQKWTEALNVILHFFTKQSKLCWFILLGFLCREKPAM